MRQHLALIAALALIGAACGPSTADAPTAPTTSFVITTTSTEPPTTAVVTPERAVASIEVWAPEEVAGSVRDAASGFEIDTGVAVTVTAVATDLALDLILADPTTAPDVFIGPHTWLTLLADAGIVEPLPARSEVVAGALAAVTLRDVVFAAPLGVDTVVQLRNPDLLAVAPTTVESFAAGCPATDDAGATCLLLATDSVDGHYPFITAAGGYLFGPDPYDGWDADDVGLDSAESIAGGLIMQTIVDGAGILDAGSTSVEERFAAGDAPLLWGTSESLQAVRAAGGKYIVENLPTIADQPARVPLRVTAAWVNAFSPGKEAAVDFVTRFLADPATADQIATRLGLAPTNVEFDGDADLVPFVLAARAGDPVPTIYQTAFAWEQLAVAFSDIRDGDDPAGVLMDAAVEIRKAPSKPPPPDEG